MAKPNTTAIDVAIATAGGVVKLARQLGVTRQAVDYWRKTRVPPERVASLIEAAEGRISKRDLRPDLW